MLFEEAQWYIHDYLSIYKLTEILHNAVAKIEYCKAV